MTEKEEQNTEHSFVTDYEGENIEWRVEKKSLLLDLKYLLKEYYTATFTQKGESLLIKFNNGQNFEIKIKESYDKSVIKSNQSFN